jgi:glycosyltransferase involved in cell wall biosynthesis
MTPTPASLRVVVIDEEIPYPLNTGKRIRTYHLLSRLARRHQIQFICYPNIDSAEYCEARRQFESIGIECRTIGRTLPTQSVLAKGPGFYGKLALNLLSPRPYLVDKHRSLAMQNEIDRIDREERVDLWHCEWTPYAQYFHEAVASPLVVSAHNVESLIWERYFANEANPAKRWYIGKQWRKFEGFERWAFSRAASVVTVSPEDAKLATERLAARHTTVVENGVDMNWFRAGETTRTLGRMLFVGSLDWRPNLDGVVQFIERVLPKIVARFPVAEFHVVGRRPPQWLRDLAAQTEGVVLHADVEDVRPHFDAAQMMVVPLRIGGGSRLKILEATAMQLPVASTRVGAEGLELTPGQHYLPADSIADLAKPIIESLENAERLGPMAEAAFSVVSQKYDWDAIADKLDGAWRRAARSSSDSLTGVLT